MATFGRWAGTLERGLWADDRTRGAAFAGAALLPVLAGGVALERATGRRTLARVLVTAAATWAVLGARTLAAEGRAMARHLEDADLPAAGGPPTGWSGPAGALTRTPPPGAGWPTTPRPRPWRPSWTTGSS